MKSRVLKGWGEIAEFLGQTVSVAQRWQNEGMPVTREGRFVDASPEELTAWVGTEPATSKVFGSTSCTSVRFPSWPFELNAMAALVLQVCPG